MKNFAIGGENPCTVFNGHTQEVSTVLRRCRGNDVATSHSNLPVIGEGRRPNTLDGIIYRAVEKKPENGYQHVWECSADLQHMVELRTIHARAQGIDDLFRFSTDGECRCWAPLALPTTPSRTSATPLLRLARRTISPPRSDSASD